MSEAGKSVDLSQVFSESKAKYGEKYDEHLLQQYLLYVQMADKISERRSLANTFFLTANTAILSAFGIVSAIYTYFPIDPWRILWVRGLVKSCTPVLRLVSYGQVVSTVEHRKIRRNSRN